MKRGFIRKNLENIYGFIEHGILRRATNKIDKGLRMQIKHLSKTNCTSSYVIYLCEDIKDRILPIKAIYLVKEDFLHILSNSTDMEAMLDRIGLKIWTSRTSWLLCLSMIELSYPLVFGDYMELLDDNFNDADGYIRCYNLSELENIKQDKNSNCIYYSIDEAIDRFADFYLCSFHFCKDSDSLDIKSIFQFKKYKNNNFHQIIKIPIS